MLVALLLVLVGCDLGPSEPDVVVPPPSPDLIATPAPVPSEPVEGAPTPDPTPAPAPKTAAQLHEDCLVRVEFPESDGECKRDSQCASTGCNNEICVPKSALEDGVMSTCEERDCFRVLDACGCDEGRCRWSLKEG